MNQKDKLLKIINHYGIMSQLKYFQSEIFELNEAIICGENGDLDNGAINHIAEEIADVMVMLMQFKEHYEIDESAILKIMNEKIDRQLERIEGEKNE